MLDPRLYRAAFLPALLAILIAAFSLGERPDPIRSALSPDTFSADQAMVTLEQLASSHPARRPGSPGDRALAGAIERRLRAAIPAGTVEQERFQGRTIDGRRELINVVATRTGRPGRGIAVVAHRDAAGRDARAELSSTAALLELARIAGGGRFDRTITFISTSGGSGGFAGARRAARTLDQDLDAVLVLGPLAPAERHHPHVVGFPGGGGQAPLQLVRTVEEAVSAEVGTRPGTPSAAEQATRMAVPITLGEQGPLLRAGLPAVLLSATGERTPAAGAPIRAATFEQFGRAALRALYALDGGRDLEQRSPTSDLVLRGKRLPGWVVRMLVLALALPALVVTADAALRLRRRGDLLGPWLTWSLLPALPLLLGGIVAVVLSLTGLIVVSPPAPLPASELRLTAGVAAAAITLALVIWLSWVLTRPLLLRAASLKPGVRPDAPAAGVMAGLVLAVLVIALWVVNPYAAALLVPGLHLWAWAAAPETDMSRAGALAMALLGLVLPIALIVVDAQAFGTNPLQTVWFWVLAIAGGSVPVWAWTLGCLLVGTAISVFIIVLRRSATPDAPERITMRGPRSYAGPGSLGGTDSALRQ